MEHLNDEMFYAEKLLQGAQAQYKTHFGARLCYTTDNVLPGDLVFFETTLTKQLHK